MKILQVCKKFPFPARDGEALAIQSLSKAMHALGCEVSLLAMNTSKHYYTPDLLLPKNHPYKTIDTVDIDNKIKWSAAFLNLFSSQSYHIARFISDDFSKKLIQLLEKETFDLIQLETLYLAPYIPIIRAHSKAYVAMRAHNVEHEIWERITENTRFLPKKWYLKYLTAKLKKYELKQLQDNVYDALVAITQRDLNNFIQMGYSGMGVVTPVGIDCKTYSRLQKTTKQKITLSFIGSLDWMPNQEGLLWFLNNIWTHLIAEFPDLELHVAGRNTPDWLKQQQRSKVHIHGEVPDAPAFINQHPLMIVPLLSGSGIRVKILEGMALGKAVLTTSMGLEGIPAKHQSEVLIADTPEEFSQIIRTYYHQQEALVEIGQKAKLFVEQNFDAHVIGKKLLGSYETLMAEV